MQSKSPPCSTASIVRAFGVPCVVVFVQLCWMIAFPFLAPGSTIQYPFFVYGTIPTVGTLILLLWFLCQRPRTAWYRYTVLLIFSIVALTQLALLDPSLRLTRIFVFQPVISSTVAVTMFVVRNQPSRVQLRRMISVLLVLVDFTCAVRMEGMNGALIPKFTWRWQPTSEQRPLQSRAARGVAIAFNLPAVAGDYDWPAFRGSHRDNVVRNVRLDTDWIQSPPKLLWRLPIGPGWSSFCVVGDCAFTQEQRGPDEVISCRSVATGELSWIYAVEGRFEDSSSGPGPRSTPAYAGGRLFVLTATGLVFGLDATTGSLLWQEDLKEQFGADVPHWGFASSPLIVEDQVVVFTGAGHGESVAAFDVASGAVRWTNGNGRYGYSSPHWICLQRQPQILMASNQGIESFDAMRGTLLWSHVWDIGYSPRIVQPCPLPGNALLLATGYGKGTRRLQVEVHERHWSARPIWTNRRFRPYFNDFVYHDGFAYGFDGNILTCLDVRNGERRWQRRGFGNGQVLLLQLQELLLVLSETGVVSLIAADENNYQLLAQFQALEGKTWNHPVIRGAHLLVRNGSQAACYELALVESPQPSL